ncbi:MAG: metallophosphoesterase, partial [Planctomycetes bacterium]|nr:metallophosphoesterase [Planctomycetota bacterium]
MSDLRVIHITDLHLGGADAVLLLREMMFRMQSEYQADAIFVTGDMVAGVREDWQHTGDAYAALWKDLGVPVFHCPGNHDIKSDDDTYDVGPYEKYCGPSDYIEMFKGFCIVGYNSLSGHSQLRMRQRERDLKNYGCNYQWPGSASLTERELAKIKKKAGRKPIILLQHLVPWQPEMIRAQAVGVKAIFSGHWHASKIHSYKDCISYNSPNALFGGIDGSQAGCLIIDFNKDGSSKGQFVPKLGAVTTAAKVKRSDYKWTQEFSGATERSAIVNTGDAIVMSTWDRSGLKHNVTYALNPKNGKILWKRRTDQAIKRALISVGDVVIGNGYGGTVYAMDAQTGKIRWAAAIGNGVDRFLNSSPISDG